MEVTLNTEELELLVAVLERRHREILHEISRTHHRDFKQRLRNDERLLDSMLNRLKGTAVHEVRVA